jgi:hypothetical protein
MLRGRAGSDIAELFETVLLCSPAEAVDGHDYWRPAT